ncbi:MAG: AAA family ATPase [Candidatus Omnitrophica bacterium]|nr:AAA family ATPase [Candidatus Omnitrophota bacterium]
MPPYLAGREAEQKEFKDLLSQDVILKNLVLTGLRGVGKTVLLETLKPIAITEGWLWVGAEFSESTSVSDEHLCTRLLTDLSAVSSSLNIPDEKHTTIGFGGSTKTLNFQGLLDIYHATPGLVIDKIKRVLEVTWQPFQKTGRRGIIFAYDEAQNLVDQAEKEQYPLSLLLDLFQSIQKMGIPFMLVLTGLPTLFPKLVEARTFAERMFRVITLERLNKQESMDAIVKPTEKPGCTFRFRTETVDLIYQTSGGYPYFIQFICRELFDAWIQKLDDGQNPVAKMGDIVRKLDTDFFSGRWAKATDRQRELLEVISYLSNCDAEFTVQEVVEKSKQVLSKPFSSSHANQMLSSLCAAGLVYKNRHGKYSFAVPLLGTFIQRQVKERDSRTV